KLGDDGDGVRICDLALVHPGDLLPRTHADGTRGAVDCAMYHRVRYDPLSPAHPTGRRAGPGGHVDRQSEKQSCPQSDRELSHLASSFVPPPFGTVGRYATVLCGRGVA